jgi:hypothetical protein
MDIAAQRILVINENRSYGEVLYLIADAFQKKRAKWNLGGGVLKLISAFVFVKELLRMRGLISKETVDAATSEFRFSGERLLNLCGYEFQGLEQVIGDACKWYKKSPPK